MDDCKHVLLKKESPMFFPEGTYRCEHCQQFLTVKLTPMNIGDVEAKPS